MGVNGSALVTPEARRALVEAILERYKVKPKARRVEPEIVRREYTGRVVRVR